MFVTYPRSIIPDIFLADKPDNYYVVSTAPKNLAVPVRDLKEHLRLPLDDDSQDIYLKNLIIAATEFAQTYTRRVFITTEFKTFRDCFPPCITLRKSPLIAVSQLDYLVDGVPVVVDPLNYEIVFTSTYSSIHPVGDIPFPTDGDNVHQAVTVTFTAGYGPRHTDVPQSARTAILMHAASLYENRGDCDGVTIPLASKQLYDTIRINQLIPLERC